MKRKVLTALLTMAMICSLLVGCGSSKTQEESSGISDQNQTVDETTVGDIIDIGVVLTITGANAPVGNTQLQGIEEVVNQVNANGGVNGKQINLVIQDSSDDTDTALNAVNLLLENGCSAIIGPHWSSQVYAVRDVIEAGGVPVIVGGTNYKLPVPENNYLFLGRPSDQIQAGALATYIAEKGNVNKIGILYSSDDFGQGAYEVAAAVFEENGIAYEAENHNTTDTDYSSTLLKMQAAGCDALLLWTSDNPMIIIARQINELGINEDMDIYCAPAIGSSVLGESVNHSWLEGFYCVQENLYDDSDADVKAFGESYKENYGLYPDINGLNYANMTYILVDALNRAENPNDPEAVKKALEATDDLETIFGPASCDENNSLTHAANITQWDTEVDGLVFLEKVENR